MAFLDEVGLAHLWQKIKGPLYAPTSVALQTIYQPGALYISTTSTNPETLFGFGKWERIQDVFLLAAGEKFQAGTTGGEETHELTVDEMPQHSHTATLSSSGKHTHTIGTDTDVTYNASGKCCSVHKAEEGADQFNGRTSENGEHTHDVTIENTGSSKAHNNMPPYLAVYVWYRKE